MAHCKTHNNLFRCINKTLCLFSLFSFDNFGSDDELFLLSQDIDLAIQRFLPTCDTEGVNWSDSTTGEVFSTYKERLTLDTGNNNYTYGTQLESCRHVRITGIIIYITKVINRSTFQQL